MFQKVCFKLALTFYTLGLFVSFYPGAEWFWFTPVIVLAIIGFFWKHTAVRIIAILIVIHSTAIIIDGFYRQSKRLEYLEGRAMLLFKIEMGSA